jgi:molybdopterin synthase sulfur carrier subunit
MQKIIDLRLYASLQKYSPSDAGQFPIEPGTCLLDLVKYLGIPPEQTKLFFINGVRGDPNTVLTGGERVAIFPPIGGG